MLSQSTNHILLIKPAEFYCNEQTIETNHYQILDKKKTKKEMLQEALLEFKAFENNLKRNKIKVTTLMGQVGCPDNIFPNWAVSHNDQTIDLFSMLGKNRRLEKSKKHISFLNQTYSTKNDYSDSENESIFLEGTSSLVLDRINHLAYMGISERSDPDLAQQWCDSRGYKLIKFSTKSHTGNAIYHTDVMMYIGTELAVICSECIDNNTRELVLESLQSTHHIMEISSEQLISFCGNCIEVCDENNESHLIMSSTAYQGYSKQQKEVLLKHYKSIIHSKLESIEKYGGGSARCMIMELF
jgi:hypothetical protein|tara:strand:- start:1039 stop:1935 length:897 start_codon:yes stop_codon:yes gene_type:complete